MENDITYHISQFGKNRYWNMFFNLPRSAENDNFLNIPTVNLPGGDFYGPLKEPDGTFSWNFANILELVLQMD